MSKVSRRSFVKRSVAAGLFSGISAKSYRATFAAEAPSERVRVGMIGVGLRDGPLTLVDVLGQHGCIDLRSGHSITVGERDGKIHRTAMNVVSRITCQ